MFSAFGLGRILIFDKIAQFSIWQLVCDATAWAAFDAVEVGRWELFLSAVKEKLPTQSQRIVKIKQYAFRVFLQKLTFLLCPINFLPKSDEKLPTSPSS